MPEIRFRDSSGWQWEVVEHPSPRQQPPVDAVRRLYFLNRYETRRCDEFPADWAKRSPKDLMELWEDAEPL